MHTAAQIADRRGLLTPVTQKGDRIDVGELPISLAERLHDAVLTDYGKGPGHTWVTDGLVKQAGQSAATAPPGSVRAFLLIAQQGDRRWWDEGRLRNLSECPLGLHGS